MLSRAIAASRIAVLTAIAAAASGCGAVPSSTPRPAASAAAAGPSSMPAESPAAGEATSSPSATNGATGTARGAGAQHSSTAGSTVASAPGEPAPSGARPPAGSAPAATPSTPGGPSIVMPRGSGWSLGPTDVGPFTLAAGTYRLAWWAPGCTFLAYSLVDATAVSPLENPTRLPLPGGEILIRGVRAGSYYLTHGGSCSATYAMRLESTGG